MPTPLGELVFNILFKSNTTTLRDIVKGISNLSVTSALATFGLDKVYESLSKIVGESLNYTVGLTNMSLATQLSTEEMEDWGRIARKINSDASQLQSTVGKVATGLAQMHQGKPVEWISEAVSQLALFGRTKIPNILALDPKQFMEKLREGYQQMSALNKINLATSIGANDAMLRYLNSKREDLDLSKEINHENAKQIENIEKIGKSWGELHTTLIQLKNDITETVAPLIVATNKLMDSFIKAFPKATSTYGAGFLTGGPSLASMALGAHMQSSLTVTINSHGGVKETADEFVHVIERWWEKERRKFQGQNPSGGSI